MEYLWQRTRQSIAALLGKYPEAAAHIRGISFSGQMHGMVAVDKNGKPVRDAIIWADQRSGDAIGHIWDTISEKEWKRTCLLYTSRRNGMQASTLSVCRHGGLTVKEIRSLWNRCV